MPVDNTNEEEVIENEETPDPEAVEETDETSQIQIGDKSFKTEAEALAYARDHLTSLEVEAAKADAYRQGILEGGKNVTVTPNVTTQKPAEEDEKEWEQKFYENPKKAIAEAMARAKAEAKAEALQTVGVQTEEQRLWSRFSDLHPDLSDFKTDVELMGDKHKEIIMTLAKTKGEDEAMNFLAQKTRAKFQQWAEKSKPGKELPNKGGAASPSGGAGDVTKSKDKKTSDKPLSFVDQFKENKKRHHA